MASRGRRDKGHDLFFALVSLLIICRPMANHPGVTKLFFCCRKVTNGGRATSHRWEWGQASRAFL